MRVRGGRKQLYTVLELRRKVYDAMSVTNRKGYRRPGSRNPRKQA